MLFKKCIFLLLQIVMVIILGKNLGIITSVNNNFFAIIFFISYIAVYILMIWIFNRITFYISGIKLRFDRLHKKDVILIAETYLVQIFGSIVVNTLGVFFVGHLQETNQDNIRNFFSNLSPSLLVMAIILTVFVAPVLEEMVFRGYIMNVFFKNNSYYSIFFSSFLFAYLHMHSIFLTANNFFVFLAYLILGSSLGFVYYKSKNMSVNI